MGLFWSRKNNENKKSTVNLTEIKTEPQAIMGWRYVTYVEGNIAITFHIEPIVNYPDIIYIPNNLIWDNIVPDWAVGKREVIIKFINSIKWNREFEWEEDNSKVTEGFYKVIPGTIESTEGGNKLDSAHLFHPGVNLNHKQIHEIWEVAERRFAEQMNGVVNLFVEPIIENSVLNKITIPILKNNPNAKLIFHPKTDLK